MDDDVDNPDGMTTFRKDEDDGSESCDHDNGDGDGLGTASAIQLVKRMMMCMRGRAG